MQIEYKIRLVNVRMDILKMNKKYVKNVPNFVKLV
jgi:hypothetical protein